MRLQGAQLVFHARLYGQVLHTVARALAVLSSTRAYPPCGISRVISADHVAMRCAIDRFLSSGVGPSPASVRQAFGHLEQTYSSTSLSTLPGDWPFLMRHSVIIKYKMSKVWAWRTTPGATGKWGPSGGFNPWFTRIAQSLYTSIFTSSPILKPISTGAANRRPFLG